MTARSAPATLRNRDPILQVLREVMPASGLVLEVAAGTGEHAVFFARAFPGLSWRPTDADPDALASIAAWRAVEGTPNLLDPLTLSAAEPGDWPVDRADAIVCINMIHISPWAATEGLLAGAGRILPEGGVLYLYGPYREAGVDAAPSNEAFDADLRRRHPLWGLRHVEEVMAEARKHDLTLRRRVEMPANNLSLVFEKL